MFAPLNPMPLIPIGQHPGSFGFVRSHDIHTGVDLYAPVGCPVHAMQGGKVISIEWFTGETINMPWWENTRAVYIESETGVFNYGEIFERPNLKIGDKVQGGDFIGYVVPVLKHFKGRPQSMLHIELYDHGYTDTWDAWKVGESQPEHLKDPTKYLLKIKNVKTCNYDPYIKIVNSLRIPNITDESNEEKQICICKMGEGKFGLKPGVCGNTCVKCGLPIK